MIVHIDAALRAELLEVAKGRNAPKSPSQSRKKSGHWTDEQLDLIGVIGEYTVSETAHVPFDRKSYGTHGDDGVDMRIRGVACAIKTNHRHRGYMVVERWRDLAHVDAIVLVQGSCTAQQETCACREGRPTDWQVAGWIDVDTFRRTSSKENWGIGWKRYMTGAQLHPLATLGENRG